MIDKQELARLRKELEDAHEARNAILTLANEVVALSKRTIYAQQRSNRQEAEESLARMKAHHRKLLAAIRRRPDMLGNNAVRTAGQELVEAASYLSVERKGTLPTAKSLGVDALTYFLGIGDLSGELVRSAVLASLKGDLGRVREIHQMLEIIYGELLAVNAREADLRRKIDKAGYDLEKVENLILDLTLKRELSREGRREERRDEQC